MQVVDEMDTLFVFCMFRELKELDLETCKIHVFDPRDLWCELSHHLD